jgi:hypothetical protein
MIFYLLVFTMSVGESLIFAGKTPERQEYFLGVHPDLVVESNNPGKRTIENKCH